MSVCLRFANVGFKVIGFDIDPAKTKKLNSAQNYIRQFSNEQIREAIQRDF